MPHAADDIRIGIALGGGAARGWAHIGVIKALQQRGIQPSIITGCSSGALVGACYAANKLDDLQTWAESLEWKEMVSMLDFSFNGGMIRGRKLIDFFEEMLGDRDITDLRYPFGVVATDLERGQEIWLRDGRLMDALRASIAMPGLFAPSRHGKRWLVDGGLVNPVPISLARAMGADVVIAVDLNSDIMARRTVSPFSATKTDKLDGVEEGGRIRDHILGHARDLKNRLLGPNDESPSLVETVTRSLHIMQMKISRSRMAGDPPELIISPRLGEIGLMEFHRANEAIEEGYNAVSRVSDELLWHPGLAPK